MKFTDLSEWDQLFFRVYMCVSLGEYPDDHGLTLEEIDFVFYWMYDIATQCSGTTNKGDHCFSYGYSRGFVI